MKTRIQILSLALALAVMARAETQDVLTLKDGRLLKGQVVEETDDKIFVLIKGVKRSYSRSFVTKVAYGSGPAGAVAAPASVAAPEEAPPSEALPAVKPSGNLTTDLALRYRVPESEVIWVRRQGITDTDLPLLFLVAATAGVVPGAVVSLRLAGNSWGEIESHYGMEPSGIYFSPGPWVAFPFYHLGYYHGWGGWRGWGHGYPRGYYRGSHHYHH